MSSMWRVVCKGPGPLDRHRRVVDCGPLHPQKDRAEWFATFLRGTGLYESVVLVSTGVPDDADVAPPPPRANAKTAGPLSESMDDLSKLFD